MDDLREVIARAMFEASPAYPDKADAYDMPHVRNVYDGAADAALAAIKAAGFVVVPAEPTEAMKLAGCDTLICNSKPS